MTSSYSEEGRTVTRWMIGSKRKLKSRTEGSFLSRRADSSQLIQKNSPISGAVAASPGMVVIPNPSSINRKALWC
jgi:hypothetical protein